MSWEDYNFSKFFMKKVKSAGGIIIEKGKILLVKLPHAEGYVFPKGHIEKGETAEQTALREVREETGFGDLQIISKLGVVTRPAVERDGTEVIKDIHLFLMKITGGTKGNPEEITEWLTIEEAVKHLLPQEAIFLGKIIRNSQLD